MALTIKYTWAGRLHMLVQDLAPVGALFRDLGIGAAGFALAGAVLRAWLS
jgi:hypothetical protein|tara:strand:+ start:1838 stop:1987 length:150 start_codon:yes stop_codon:yes gene_type:complete